MKGRIFHAKNRWKLILVVAGVGFVLAAGLGLARDLWLNDVATTNCREIEQLKGYVRDTIDSGAELRDQLDFGLSPAQLELLAAQDVRTKRRFRAEPCPRAD